MADEATHSQVFRYNPRLARQARRSAAIGLVALIVLAGAIVRYYTAGPVSQRQLTALPFVAVIGLAVVWMGLGAISQVIVTTADLELDDDGLRLHLAGGWRARVPWDKLAGATLSERVQGRHYRRAGLVGQRFALVQVRGLSVLNVLAATQFGIGFAPVFVVTAHHEGSGQLVGWLRERVSVVL